MLKELLLAVRGGTTMFESDPDDQWGFEEQIDAAKEAARRGLLLDVREQVDGGDATTSFAVHGLTEDGVLYCRCVSGEFRERRGIMAWSCSEEFDQYHSGRRRILHSNRFVRWAGGLVGSEDAAVVIAGMAGNLEEVVSALGDFGDLDPAQSHTQLISDPFLGPGIDEVRDILCKPRFSIFGESLPGGRRPGPTVFLCYMDQDRGRAELLYSALEDAGAVVFMDKKRLKFGEEWEYTIRKRIRDSDVFVPLLRPGFDERGYRQVEVRTALEKAKTYPPGKQDFIRPYILEPCELPDWCGPFHVGDPREQTPQSEFVESVLVDKKF